ncbi:NADH-quinone oxidoreductase subunit A [Paenibacillus sp. GSMTC-2017]|nr:NADH-quinone oxidoreductase subunit A [Paenibacillus sp. GSMTC-2017]
MCLLSNSVIDGCGSICYNCEEKLTKIRHPAFHPQDGGDCLENYINNYVVVAIFAVLGLLLPVVALTVGKILRPKKPTEMKQSTYESGNEPVGEGQVRFNIRYYLFALMFVIFDVETVFLYPWAVAYNKLGLFVLVEMIIFAGMLLIGLLYAYKKRVLKWN